ncbi:MAG: App1 family protein [Alphaproteobacteria bacterium]
MSRNRGWFARRWHALRGLARVLSRPVRRAVRGRGGVALQTYRGYGSRREVFMIGRVLRQPGGPATGNAFADLGRLFMRRGIRDAVLTVRFDGSDERISTDRDGYFRLHVPLTRPPPSDAVWHPVVIELNEPERIVATGEVFIPPPACSFVTISDIDDTVVYTGVANKAMMLWRLFMQDAGDRVAFPGMAAVLNAHQRRPSGHEKNPILDVSRGTWSIYEILDEFFNQHEIPIGPILFLREWGLTLHSPLPRRAKDHKLALIRNMLELYGELPFVLIGDSGQRDPEIYAQVVQEHPGRVAAIYIRDVTRSAKRDRGIEALAREVAASGSTLVVAADSLEMARHAAAHGLIAPHFQEDVVEERDTAAENGTAAGQP